jgi:hypothetical protein
LKYINPATGTPTKPSKKPIKTISESFAEIIAGAKTPKQTEKNTTNTTVKIYIFSITHPLAVSAS